MKIILSRKGFDSSNGSIPSPILPDGTLLSLPIPAKFDSISFDDLNYNGVLFSDILRQLKGKEDKTNHYKQTFPERPIGLSLIFCQYTGLVKTIHLSICTFANVGNLWKPGGKGHENLTATACPEPQLQDIDTSKGKP